ncbi:MAG: hypothetical protein R2795_21430 [Saprospiraceae bacterium]
MKLSKALLQALVVGASLQSCVALVEPEDITPDIPKAEQEVGTCSEHTGNSDPGEPFFDCPACGMG